MGVRAESVTNRPVIRARNSVTVVRPRRPQGRWDWLSECHYDFARSIGTLFSTSVSKAKTTSRGVASLESSLAALRQARESQRQNAHAHTLLQLRRGPTQLQRPRRARRHSSSGRPAEPQTRRYRKRTKRQVDMPVQEKGRGLRQETTLSDERELRPTHPAP